MTRENAASAGGSACWHCGYDLSGHARPGACPECGTPIDDYIAGCRREDGRNRFLIVKWGVAFVVMCMANVALPIVFPSHPLIPVGLSMLAWSGFAVASFTIVNRRSLRRLPVLETPVIIGCALSIIAAIGNGMLLLVCWTML